MDGENLSAFQQLVFAGLATTKTLTSFDTNISPCPRAPAQTTSETSPSLSQPTPYHTHWFSIRACKLLTLQKESYQSPVQARARRPTYKASHRKDNF